MPDRILDAARAVLAARGYAGTTMKSVAAAAGVTPTVVSSLYRNREALLAAALRLPLDPSGTIPQVIAQGVDGLGERLVRTTLSLMDDPQVRADLSVAATAGGGAAGQARGVVDDVQASLVDPVAALLGVPDARMRAALIGATLGGLVGARYVVRIEPLASASTDQVVAMFAPGIQSLLDPTRPID